MDVKGWALDRIMQLPDDCFGRRFYVGCTFSHAPPAATFGLCDPALPELCVLREVHISMNAMVKVDPVFRIGLSDILPASAAIFNELEPLIPGFGVRGREPRSFVAITPFAFHLVNIRQPVFAAGRHVVVSLTQAMGIVEQASFNFIFATIPKEVSDCLFYR